MTQTRFLGLKSSLWLAFCTFCLFRLVAISQEASKGSVIVTQKPNPSGPGSIVPFLTTTPQGSWLLSWLEPAGNSKHYALRFATLQGNRWSDTRTVLTSTEFQTDPSVQPVVLTLPDGELVACWTEHRVLKPGAEAEQVYVSGSRDGGRTWTTPVVVHRDGVATEHSYISLVPLDDGQAMVIWLDGRKGDRSMLMQASFGSSGKLGPEVILDDDVCECCPTSAVRTADGTLVAYRNHAANEIRDIGLVRLTNGRWLPSRPLHQDGWKINGCPTNSVTLSATGRRVAAAWFTAPDDKPQVKVAFSQNGGETFGAPLLVSGPQVVGRASVALLSNSEALVTWLEPKDKVMQLLARRVGVTGAPGPPVVVGSGKASEFGFPRIAPLRNEALIAWADGTTQGRVHTALAQARP